MARGRPVMLGFWNRQAETAQVIDSEGWLHTGDIARIDAQGYLHITGRLKDIIVLANGEKVSPADMEMAIAADPLVEQVMVIGEGKPFLSAILVPAQEQWRVWMNELGRDPDAVANYRDQTIHRHLIERIGEQLHDFPGYAKICALTVIKEPWSIENGLLTPTLKTKRSEVLARYDEDVKQLYQGH